VSATTPAVALERRTAWGVRAALGASAALVLVFLGLGRAFIQANSQTSDEGVHLVAGYAYLMRGDFRLNAEHPPLVKQLAALAVWLRYRLPFNPDPLAWRQGNQWGLALDFLYRGPVPGDDILAVARLPNLVLGALLVALVGLWAWRLWGPGAAVLGMALGALEPNLVAHASLVTTDVGVSVFLFLAVYLLWEYARLPSWPRLVGLGLTTGLTLVTKFSGLLVLPILGALGAGLLLLGEALALPPRRDPGLPRGGRDRRRHRPRRPGGGARRGGLGRRLLRALPVGLVVVALALLVVPAVYLVHDTERWFAGLKDVYLHRKGGHPAFFLGEYSREGWWSYFLVAFLIKTPVGSLLLVLASLVLWRAGTGWRRRDALFLLLPVALVLVATARGRINIGLRHVLPIYPFLFVAASRLATVRLGPRWLVPVLLGAAVSATALSSLRVAPHQLAYFNELVGGPGEGYRYLSDSNIDWGQALKGVRAYMDREGLPMIYLSYFGNVPPAVYGIRYQYAPAFGGLRGFPFSVFPDDLARRVLAISVLNLQGTWFREPDLYHWLFRRTPVAKIGYAIFVYDLTSDAEAHVRLATVYLKDGLPNLALPELRRALRLDPGNREAARLLASLSAGS
jgi:hypothetical protein